MFTIIYLSTLSLKHAGDVPVKVRVIS